MKVIATIHSRSIVLGEPCTNGRLEVQWDEDGSLRNLGVFHIPSNEWHLFMIILMMGCRQLKEVDFVIEEMTNLSAGEGV